MFSKTILALTLAVGSAQAVRFLHGQATGEVVTATRDEVMSPQGYAYIKMDPDGSVVGYYLRGPTYRLNSVGTSSMRANQRGQLYLTNPFHGDQVYGNVITNSCLGSEWYVAMLDNANFRTMSACGNGWNSGLTWSANPLWGFQDVMGYPFETNPHRMNKSSGAKVAIYYLDSGFNPAPTLVTHNSFTLDGVYLDQSGHGTSMSAISTSTLHGISQAAVGYMVQIVPQVVHTPIFTERGFVRGMKFAMQHNPGTGVQKIINLSVAFDNGYTDVSNCAIQWAYKARAYVIAAAGNQNKRVDANNPYAFIVSGYARKQAGATYSLTQNNVNFGASVDLWAPATFTQPKGFAGSSFATAFTSAVAAAAISQWPTLRTWPNKGYRYLRDLSDTTIIHPQDGKVLASANAGNRALSMVNLPTRVPAEANYFTESTAPDFCGRLNLHATTPNWDALITIADNTRMGHVVASTTTFATSPFGGFSYLT